MLGDSLPALVSAVPGPASREWVKRLAAHECPASTARRERRAELAGLPDADPIVWVDAVGANVRDADGNVFVDLCAGYGVTSVGHRHPEVVAAGQAQLTRLPHAMGDAFPDPRRILLMEQLCARTGFERVIFGSTGSDAIEAAIKTAVLATGRSRVLTFTGAFHGLASASLAAIGYQVEAYRGPFEGMLGAHTTLAPFGGAWPDLHDFAAVLIEPVQGRGGMRAPPPGWLGDLHAAAHAAGALVIHDEVFCGLGRTGSFLAADRERRGTHGSHEVGLRPDLLCLGKALGGGFPLSICLGTSEAMGAWGHAAGQPSPTQTFLGNPVGCAMASVVLDLIDREGLVERAARVGARWAEALAAVPGVRRVTGRGLMLGVVMDDAPGVTRRMLQRGWIVLPCGERSEALGLTPPLTIAEPLLEAAVSALAASM